MRGLKTAVTCVLAVCWAVAQPAGAPGHAVFVDYTATTVPAGVTASVPEAACLPGDRPETTSIQGRGAPRLDQLTGRTRQPYFCNMRLVGETNIYNRGANQQMAWAGDCAYVGSLSSVFLLDLDPVLSTSHPAGVAVIDASDPRHPQPGRILRSRGSADVFETLRARDTPTRKILVAGDYEGTALEVYDVSEDCRNPVLKTTYTMPFTMHNLTLSHDGMLLYATVGIHRQPVDATLLDAAVMVIDLSDMAHPRTLAVMPLVDSNGTKWSTHEVELSRDGRRLYATATTGIADTAYIGPPALRTGAQRVLIFDNSDIVDGRPNPRLRFISGFEGGNHSVRVGRAGGRTIAVSANELGECRVGSIGPGAWPRIADITDEERPREIAQYRLEVHDPANCPEVALDHPTASYSSHYNEIDSDVQTRLGLFPMSSAGLRVADLRDPAHPKEIGYYIPGANPSALNTSLPVLFGGPFDDNFAQAVWSYVRYRPETGHIWFVSYSGGFHIAEIAQPPDGLGPAQ